MPKSFPPRIHVLLASKAREAVILRRGPSGSVASIRWNRKDDTFTLGQWLRGRIYERRSDLSPDGRHLIYFAMKGGSKLYSWTAVSRAPYLKAVSLFSKGDCWNGGGIWTQPDRYWLNDGYGHEVIQNTTKVTRDLTFDNTGQFRGECPDVYYRRLNRDGWLPTAVRNAGHHHDVTVFEKKIGHGWILRKLAHSQVDAPKGRGCYWDEHQLFRPESGTQLDFPDWEWADLDGKRLVWAEHGTLNAGYLTAKGIKHPSQLHDFSPMKFEAVQAPY